jgi:lipopolysaccharide biosynthesis glycosyltransferase
MDSDMVTLCGHAVKDYCNAGMFLLSHSHKKLLHLAPNLMRRMDKLWYHDQSLFNHIFRPYLQVLDDKYNRIMLSDDSDGGAFILHFTGGSKKKMKDYSGRSLTYKYKLGGR